MVRDQPQPIKLFQTMAFFPRGGVNGRVAQGIIAANNTRERPIIAMEERVIMGVIFLLSLLTGFLIGIIIETKFNFIKHAK